MNSHPMTDIEKNALVYEYLDALYGSAEIMVRNEETNIIMKTIHLLILLAGATEAQAKGIIHGTWYHDMITNMIDTTTNKED